MTPPPASQDPRPDEPDPWPVIPDPPPAPAIPEELRKPVELPESMRRPKGGSSEVFQAASGYASAFSFIATILAFGALGWGVDYFLHTSPWGITSGLGLGLVGATWRLVRDANAPPRR